MKFQIEKGIFSQALNIIGKSVGSNHTLQVLNNFLIEAKDGSLFFSSTNLETSVKYFVKATIEKEGSVLVPFRNFQSYISLTPEGKVDFESSETFEINLKTLAGKSMFKGFDPKDFPKIHDLDKPEKFLIESEKMKKIISKSVFCISPSNTKPVLTGVNMILSGEDIEVFSTDSYRMTYIKEKIKNSFPSEKNIVVPGSSLSEVSRIIGDSLALSSESFDIQVYFSKNQVLFEIGNIKYFSRIIEGNYPNCRPLIPTANNLSCEIDNITFSRAIKRVSIFAKENSSKILLKMENSNMNISTPGTQIGNGEENINCVMNGENSPVCLNGDFISDILSVIGDEKIKIEFNGEKYPVCFRPYSSKDFFHIIVPLKIY